MVCALIPAGSRAKDALSGTWLGHPLHPPLTDLVEQAARQTSAEDVVDDVERLAVVVAAPQALHAEHEMHLFSVVLAVVHEELRKVAAAIKTASVP